MSNYNPQAPRILGEEWVGIHEEPISFTPGVANVEVGTTFSIPVAKTMSQGLFFLDHLPSGKASGTVMMAHVYPSGSEEDSGPVKRVVIPCSNGSSTGTWSFSADTSSVEDALNSPSDGKYIQGRTGLGATRHQFWFRTGDYSQVLEGKRILAVNVLYSLGNLGYARPFEERHGWIMSLYAENPWALQWGLGFGDSEGVFGNLLEAQSLSVALPPSRAGAGTFLPFANNSNTNNIEVVPWRNSQIQRFAESTTASQRLSVLIYGDTDSTVTITAAIQYLALEVLYCEERRVAIGGKRFGIIPDLFASSGVAFSPWVDNFNNVGFRDPNTGVSAPVIPAGDYLLTLSMERGPDSDYRTSTESPVVNAMREFTTVSGIEGRVVTRPWPNDLTILDEQFAVERTRVLPQLAITASGSANVNEVHVYGKQAKAAVYGSVTATQEILDTGTGGSFSYPQVRFYARRYGDTTQPLVLSSPTISGAGQSVSITPAELDALTEIIDGWRQVTLRFPTAPTMGGSTNPQWRFTSTGEVAGNQWQVLGLWAPMISGAGSGAGTWVPNNPWLSYSSARTNSIAHGTYGQPTFGATVNLGWLSPMVTGTTDDPYSDAVLMFSQDPPTPSGFAVTPASQALSTVDPTCFAASCVPTSITYNRLSWTTIPASGMPTSGFGSYEIQRYDSVDGDFSTIARITTPSVSGFSDFEARVGYPSVYRIRAVNVYDFAGLWSPQVTGTVTAPGVAGASTGLLIFTTNSVQSGLSNLAYSEAWNGGEPVEDFAWPESGTVVLQDMYGKDYPTAFRPLERGGERFARTILINASGIPPAVTARGFDSLRDMAWANVPYICVRDETGERWYATVVVPSGSVRRMINRGRLCLAAVQIIETTADPYPVNP